MQLVLVIDITASPARALVVDTASAAPAIMEEASVELDSNFYADLLAEASREEALAGAVMAEEEELHEEPAQSRERSNPIRELVSRITSRWSNSVLLIPQLDYVSLNLDSPFGDAKQLDKVLLLEVQDNVPFEIEDMHLKYCSFPGVGEEKFDVHVGLIPKRVLRELLALCDEADLEVTVLCPFSNTLGLIAENRVDSVGDAFVFYGEYPNFALGLFVGGKFRSEKLMHARIEGTDEEQKAAYLDDVAQRLQALTLSLENRYHLEMADLILTGPSLPLPRLENLMRGRNVRRLDFAETGDELPKRRELAALAAAFAREVKPVEPLCNLRSGEFAVPLCLNEAWGVIRQASSFFMAAMLSIIAALALIYYGRLSRLENIETSIRDNVRQVVPSLASGSGNPADTLRSQIQTIEKQLSALGSPFHISPLDAVLEISRDFKKRDRGTASLKRVNVVGRKVNLEGVAPSYASIDIIERVLRKKERTYCEIKKTVSTSNAGGTSSQNFSFSLELCES